MINVKYFCKFVKTQTKSDHHDKIKCIMACDLGVCFGVCNFICGLAVIIWNFWFFNGWYWSFCGFINLLFGICICWVSITHNFCDRYALKWFPFWENFLFTGCTYLYFTCGEIDAIFDGNFGDSVQSLLAFFVFVVGILYVLFWFLITVGNVNIPQPVPLERFCNGGGGGGGGGNDNSGYQNVK